MDAERYNNDAPELESDLPPMSSYQNSRYIIGAESEFPNGDRGMVFLGHKGDNFIWVTDCNSSNVCFEEDLVAMKHLVFEATKTISTTVATTTIRPYMLTATLHDCYTSYLSQVQEAEETEMFLKFDRLLSENFSTHERNCIMSKHMSQI